MRYRLTNDAQAGLGAKALKWLEERGVIEPEGEGAKPKPAAVSDTPDLDRLNRLIAAWNAMAKATGLPTKEKQLSLAAAKQRPTMRSALKRLECPAWRESARTALPLIPQSDFLTGRSGAWRLSFESFVGIEMADKIVAGNYANKGAAQRPDSPARPSDPNHLDLTSMTPEQIEAHIAEIDAAYLSQPGS